MKGEGSNGVGVWWGRVRWGRGKEGRVMGEGASTACLQSFPGE